MCVCVCVCVYVCVCLILSPKVLADPAVAALMNDTKAGLLSLLLPPPLPPPSQHPSFPLFFFLVSLLHFLAKEVKALNELFAMLKDDPDRATYGPGHVERVSELGAIDSLLILGFLFFLFLLY